MKMAFKVKLPFFFLFSLVLLFATLSFAKDDPQLMQCKQQCKDLKQSDERQKCEQTCRRQWREREEGGGGRGRGDDEWNPERPEERLRECERKCDRRLEGREKSQCHQQCEEQYKREKEGRGRGEGNYEGSEREEEEREQGERRGQRGHPYLFEDQHFITGARTQHGRIRLLPKFTDRSELLRGIVNYRLAILEADPQTFIVPNHWDAEAVFFVARGRGTISLVRQDKRDSFNLRCGDVLRIPAGTTIYMINRDNNQKLVLIKLLKPVSVPGEFEVFVGAGGENPESFYRAFSNEILETALNTRRERLQRLFGQQKQGVIVKANEEQIRALSRHEEGGIWPFGGESRGPINLFNKRPTQSNQYGQLYEVDARDCRHLEELDVAVSFANITQGAMTAPVYSSRSTKITTVVEGEGYIEMACPHLSSSSESQRRREGREGSPREREEREGSPRQQGERGSPTTYQRVHAPLRRGSVFIVPPGHPVVAVASKNQNLQLVCFEINARNNEKFPLAGRRNIINQMEREAKELAFNVPAREVEAIFRNQNEEFFFRGPHQQQEQEGRADA
ncbi:vicilin Cor a 11.0101 [Cornus florida]|uniref:vicilin Cor a 11.0101 n=1 Tax=Cornus florida TaxID=4283 RepID=UPI00289E4389|nr:vicilin Cor a 11.0101 [Cornus florida]